MDFLDSAGHVPFFLNVGYIATHSPYGQQHHDPALTALYQEAQFVDIPPYNSHPWCMNEDGPGESPPQAALRDRYVGYYAAVAELDRNVARIVDRVLTPNGFLLAYVGVFWKDNAMAQLREHMSFFWDYAVSHGGRHPLQRNRMTRSAHKSVLCYRRPGSAALPRVEVDDLIQGGGKDKEYHPWGQSVDEARYFIEAFSRSGDVVLDPFIGGGTTAVASEQSDRRWFGFEVDSEYARIAQERIGTEST